MTQEEKSRRIQQAEEKLRQAKAQLAKAKREEREKTRKEENHQKYVMGGIVAKYFREQLKRMIREPDKKSLLKTGRQNWKRSQKSLTLQQNPIRIQ